MLGNVCMFSLLIYFLRISSPPTHPAICGEIGGLAGEPSSVPSAESPRSPVGASQMWFAL